MYCWNCGIQQTGENNFCSKCGCVVLVASPENIEHLEPSINESQSPLSPRKPTRRIKMNKKHKILMVVIPAILVLLFTLGIILNHYFGKSAQYLIADNSLSDLEELNDHLMPEILYNENGKIPKFIDGKYTDININNEDDALRSLESVKTIMNFADPANEFKFVNETESINSKTYRLQQYYQNIPVYGSQIVVSTDTSGEASALSGNYKPEIDINIKPQVIKAKAENTVKSNYDEQIQIDSSSLVIYYDASENLYLAWQIDVSGFDSQGELICEIVFLDADTNEIISTESKIFDQAVEAEGIDGLSEKRAFVVNKISNNKYEMYDSERKISVFNFGYNIFVSNASIVSSADNKWTDSAAVSAYANLSVVSDFYKNVLLRDSIDNKGKEVVAYVHAQKSWQAWDNAEYSDDSISFGDGKNTFKPLSYGLDIVAHEYTHGVVAYTAGLIYRNQSGALNEAYADILGNLIEDDNDLEWLIGEDVMLPGQDAALRSMSDPGIFDQPTNVADAQYPQSDYGNVHTNSGIINRVAYLMWANGIDSKETLAKLWYGSLLKLNYYSDFLECRYAVISAARDLDMSEEEIAIIQDAFDMVGITVRTKEGTKEEIDEPINKTLYPASINSVEFSMRYDSVERWGLIDQSGEFVVEPTYDYIYDYQTNGYAIFRNSSLYGMLDQSGKEILPAVYDSISEFSEGICILQQNGQFILTDENLNLNQIADLNIEQISNFHEGVAEIGVRNGDDYSVGFINYFGDVVIEPQFSNSFSFYNGKCVVEDKNGRYMIIDKSGNMITDLNGYKIENVGIDTFCYVLAGTADQNFINTYGYMDYSGNVLTPAIFSKAMQYYGDYAIVTIRAEDYSQKEGVINKQGEYVIQPSEVKIEYLDEGLLRIASRVPEIPNYEYYNKSAIFDSTGRQITDYLYFDIFPNANDCFSVTDGEYTFFIDRDGNQIEDLPKLLGVGTMTILEDVIKAEIDGSLSYYTLNGKVIWQGIYLDLGNDIVSKKTIERINYFKVIKYPEIIGLMDSDVCTKINEEVKELFIEQAADFLNYDMAEVTVTFNAVVENDLLSVWKEEIVYNFDAMHPGYILHSYHINLLNGDIYQLSDLFKVDANYEEMINSIIRKQAANGEYQLSDPNISICGNDTLFECDAEGITIYFQSGEIACFADGFPAFPIKYSEMQDMIDQNGSFWKTIKG